MTPALINVTRHQRGVFTRAQALETGTSPDEFRRHVERGTWCRIRRGAYTTPDVWTSAGPAERQVLGLQAVTLQMAPPVVGSHETAAAVHGIELWDPSYEWINVTRQERSARREGGVWHHAASIPVEEVSLVDGLGVTSPRRTGLDVARYAVDHPHALVAVDSALRAGGGTYEDRAAALEAMRQTHLARTDWPGARRAGGAVAAADPRCGSVGESRTRVQLVELGFPTPLSQVSIFDERGVRLGIADFAFVAEKTLGEFDGRTKYAMDGLSAEAMSARLWAEKLRQDSVRRLGWEVERIIWADLNSPGRLAAKFRAAFARAASTGPVRGSFSLAPA